MIDWINMNIPYLCVVDTGELAGDPPELAAGENEDLHLVFGELVGVLNLETLGSLSRSCVLCEVLFGVEYGLNIVMFLRGIA